MNRRLFLVLTTATLSGCGFSLRGRVRLPEHLRQISVTGNDLGFTEGLERTLLASGVRLAAPEEESKAVLQLVRNEFSRSVRTTDERGLATSWTLQYQVEFQVKDSEDRMILPPQHISVRQMIEYDPMHQLAYEEEEEFLRQALQKEVMERILHRLRRIPPT